MTDEDAREKVLGQGLSQRLNPATLAQMHERLGDIRAWLMALTAIQAVQIGGIVAILLRQ
jgi:hypothetical protein